MARSISAADSYTRCPSSPSPPPRRSTPLPQPAGPSPSRSALSSSPLPFYLTRPAITTTPNGRPVAEHDCDRPVRSALRAFLVPRPDRPVRGGVGAVFEACRRDCSTGTVKTRQCVGTGSQAVCPGSRWDCPILTRTACCRSGNRGRSAERADRSARHANRPPFRTAS